MPPKIKKVGKYELGTTLGQGTFGKVKIAIDRSNTDGVMKNYAIKLLDKAKIRSAGLGAQIKKEIRVMKALNHPTCIKLYEVLSSKTTIFLVCELVTGGELFDRIVTDGRFDQDTARKYFIQLIQGLEHCHSLGICHRDLKPENLLLDADGGLKISDFGLASLNENPSEQQILHTACGTPNYVAPEVLMEKGYDGELADIWSAGVILYVLLAGFLPFDEAQMVDLFRKIVCADFQYPSWISPEAQACISRMLEPDPDRRARISEITSCAFYRGLTTDEFELENETINTKTVGSRKLSHFFNQEMLQEDAKPSTVFPPALINVPLDKVDYENHKVWIQGLEFNTIDWFAAKYPGRRSTTASSKTKKQLKREQRRISLSKPPITLESSIHTATTDSINNDLNSNYSGNITSIGGSNSNSLSTVDMIQCDNLLNTMDNCPPTPFGPGSGVTETDTAPHVHDEGDGDDDGEEDTHNGPKPLNAFDLINMVSGQSMNNMLLFNRNTSQTGQQGQPSFTQFTSRLPIKELMARIDYVLLNTPQVRYRICYRKCQVSLVYTSAKNHRIGAHIELFNLTSELHMVQLRRMHGSILTHHELYKMLRDEMRFNETNINIDVIHARLKKWDEDYPIFARAYADYRAVQTTAPSIPSIILNSNKTSTTIKIPSSSHADHSLRAGGGLSTMKSLIKQSKPTNAPVDSSSDDESDTDSEGSLASTLNPPRRKGTIDTSIMRTLRAGDKKGASNTPTDTPQLHTNTDKSM